MFTGLIADVGRVRALDAGGDGARLRVATGVAAASAAGDSVAVNGVCLTVRPVGGELEADVMNQTLALTSLGRLSPGDAVNVEPALRPADRLGGHIVQGHVDATVEVLEVAADGFARRLRFAAPAAVGRYLVPRGSVALEGVSLTIAALGDDWAEVSLIPETLERTTLGDARPGALLNVECDVLAKHVERLVQTFAPKEPG